MPIVRKLMYQKTAKNTRKEVNFFAGHPVSENDTDLYQSPHFSPLLPITSSIIQHYVWGPYLPTTFNIFWTSHPPPSYPSVTIYCLLLIISLTYLFPRQPCVSDVVILTRIPHQEHIVPLGYDLTASGQGLSLLILQYSSS